jgi:hypothetical protein
MQKLRQDFDLHVEKDSEWKLEQEQQWIINNKIINQTIAIQKENATQIKSLSDDTAGIIAIYKDTASVIRVGSAVQKGMVWFVKWGFIGTGVIAGIEYLIEYFNQPPMV